MTHAVDASAVQQFYICLTVTLDVDASAVQQFYICLTVTHAVDASAVQQFYICLTVTLAVDAGYRGFTLQKHCICTIEAALRALL